MSRYTRRDAIAGLASAGLLGFPDLSWGQKSGRPRSQMTSSIPLNGLVARYEQANTVGVQGTPIGSFIDTSGNAFNATQSVAADRPKVNSFTVSGGRAIYFPGGNGLTSYLTLPATLSIQTQSVSVVFILEPTYANNSNYLIDFGPSHSLFFHYNFGKLGGGPPLRTSVYLPWGPQVVGFASGSSDFKYILGNTMFTAASRAPLASPAGGSLNCYSTNRYDAVNNVYAVLIYSREITQDDVNEIYAYAASTYRVLPKSPYMLLAACGDSLTAGYVAGAYNGLGWLQQWLVNNPTYTAYNFAATGSQTSALVSPDAVYSSSPIKTVCWIWSGSNDIARGLGTVPAALSNIANFVAARRAFGWKCVTATLLPRNSGITANPNPGFEADRQTFNTAIRSNPGGIYGDTIADVGNDLTIGQAGDEMNSTYYTNDFTHLTQAGCTLALNSYFAPAIGAL